MNESGYSPKELFFDDKGRESLVNGIEKIAAAVKSTLGPRGNTVIIESPNHTHGITVTKDGVTVAKSIDLIHPVENLAVKMMKEAADKTATQAGDGTTTAIVLTEAMVKAGTKYIKNNKAETLREMAEITDQVVSDIDSKAKRLTKKTMLDVATISANNDKELGKVISDAYHSVGKNGVVTVEKSQTTETYAEVTKGLKIDRGYSSNLFVNNQRKDECILEDVLVLVTDQEINSILAIENILKPIIQANKKLLIVGTCTGNVINTLAANVVKNNLKICNVPPPSFGYRQHELMQDIAVSVGAKYFSESTGDNLELISMSDLGHVDRIVVGRDQTVLVKEQGDNQSVIDQRIVELREALQNTTKKSDRDFISERIAGLSGSVGVIYVGGNSDVEQKEKFDRVDDAVCAVRSALEEGIIPGGGIALLKVTSMFDDLTATDGQKIMREALRAPFNTILDNAGLDFKEHEESRYFLTYGLHEDWDSEGINAKTGEIGDMYKMGIIDPAKVTKNALKNALSVATTILSTNAIVTMARTYETN